MNDIATWLDWAGSEGLYWIAKRLSGNDTGASGGHQVGVYLPREFFEQAFPEIVTTERKNPKSCFRVVNFPQGGYEAPNVTATYYNNKHTDDDGTRDEFRLTAWGGKVCPIQDVENTGALMLLFFIEDAAWVWICDSPEEEQDAQAWIGRELDPGTICMSWLEDSEDGENEADWRDCIPPQWREDFPSGMEIFEFAASCIADPDAATDPDKLLLKRRSFEFEVFLYLEGIHVLPKLATPFADLQSFLDLANSVTNRRKSRSGKSLENGLSSIFKDLGLKFEEQAVTEKKKKPDFLFPSAAVYAQMPKGGSSCRMLAAKTCCKDRWRQVVDEAEKIERKHLFTLQEGVSENQFAQMCSAGIQLVVPHSHITSFPRTVRPKLMTLKTFEEEIRGLGF